MMPIINLTVNKNQFSPTLYPMLWDYSHRYEFYMGSAGSGKSWFATQKVICRCLREPIKVLVCRRYATTIRNTCFALFKDILKQWQIIKYVKIRETDFNIKFPNGSEIIFTGLDEETKLLSLAGITMIMIEEVFEVPKTIFEQLDLRLRGGTNQQIIAMFNPISKNSWLYDFCEVRPPHNFYFSKTTYLDNPFLSKEYIQTLEDMKQRNPQKARIYCYGEWGTDPEGLVFQNWRVEQFNTNNLLSMGLEFRVGADLGFRDPTAVVCSLYDKENRRIYVFDEFYKSGCQLDVVAAAIRQLEIGKTKLYMDNAEPRTIEYFRREGFNAVPCVKGKDSVKARISFLQNNEIIILPTCKNVIKEFENFAYKKDKQTGEYKDDFTHEFSHAIDGLGYAYSDIYTANRQIKTFDKALLGL